MSEQSKFFDYTVKEQIELHERTGKLLEFFNSDDFQKLDEIDRALLRSQCKHMHEYLDVLQRRIARHMFRNPDWFDELDNGQHYDT